jgi:hypothetical protein
VSELELEQRRRGQRRAGAAKPDAGRGQPAHRGPELILRSHGNSARNLPGTLRGRIFSAASIRP